MKKKDFQFKALHTAAILTEVANLAYTAPKEQDIRRMVLDKPCEMPRILSYRASQVHPIRWNNIKPRLIHLLYYAILVRINATLYAILVKQWICKAGNKFKWARSQNFVQPLCLCPWVLYCGSLWCHLRKTTNACLQQSRLVCHTYQYVTKSVMQETCVLRPISTILGYIGAGDKNMWNCIWASYYLVMYYSDVSAHE